VDYFDGPWEIEDNDAYTQANGFLRSEVVYIAYPNDPKDYFSVYLLRSGRLTIERQPDSGAGGGVQMLLFYQSTANLIAVDNAAPYFIDYTGPAGVYYIYIFTAFNYSTTAPYTLKVTYP
jgi:hypothetical protein